MTAQTLTSSPSTTFFGHPRATSETFLAPAFFSAGAGASIALHCTGRRECVDVTGTLAGSPRSSTCMVLLFYLS